MPPRKDRKTRVLAYAPSGSPTARRVPDQVPQHDDAKWHAEYPRDHITHDEFSANQVAEWQFTRNVCEPGASLCCSNTSFIAFDAGRQSLARGIAPRVYRSSERHRENPRPDGSSPRAGSLKSCSHQRSSACSLVPTVCSASLSPGAHHCVLFPVLFVRVRGISRSLVDAAFRQ